MYADLILVLCQQIFILFFNIEPLQHGLFNTQHKSGQHVLRLDFMLEKWLKRNKSPYFRHVLFPAASDVSATCWLTSCNSAHINKPAFPYTTLQKMGCFTWHIVQEGLKLKTCAITYIVKVWQLRDTPCAERTSPLITSSFRLLLFAFWIWPRSASASCHLSTSFAPDRISVSLFSLSACVLVVGPRELS